MDLNLSDKKGFIWVFCFVVLTPLIHVLQDRVLFIYTYEIKKLLTKSRGLGRRQRLKGDTEKPVSQSTTE